MNERQNNSAKRTQRLGSGGSCGWWNKKRQTKVQSKLAGLSFLHELITHSNLYGAHKGNGSIWLVTLLDVGSRNRILRFIFPLFYLFRKISLFSFVSKRTFLSKLIVLCVSQILFPCFTYFSCLSYLFVIRRPKSLRSGEKKRNFCEIKFV